MNKKDLLLLLFVLSSTIVLAQKYQYECGWYGKKTPDERSKLYPFNEAKKIVLVSFPQNMPHYKLDSTSTVEQAGIKLNNTVLNNIDFSYLEIDAHTYKPYNAYFAFEEIVLNSNQTDELSNILANYTLKKKPKEGERTVLSMSTCYTPHHAILFYNDDENVFCIIEICFMCRTSYMIPKDPDSLNTYSQIGECHNRLDLIQEFFKKSGITYKID